LGHPRVYEIGVLDEKGSFVRLQGFEPIQLDSSYYSGFKLFVEDELSEGLAVPSDPGIYESEASEEHGKNGSIENQETGKRRDIAGSGQ
tara:strand:- start:4348 stop:4614 length:267 start_codon:yes stop_codon:yes gene_type:complete